jgi:hypothetical protein
MPSSAAVLIASATAGVVVSNPIPKKTTLEPGFSRAASTASIGE